MWALTLGSVLNACANQVHLSIQNSCFEFALDMPLIICCTERHMKALMTLNFTRTTAKSNSSYRKMINLKTSCQNSSVTWSSLSPQCTHYSVSFFQIICLKCYYS